MKRILATFGLLITLLILATSAWSSVTKKVFVEDFGATW